MRAAPTIAILALLVPVSVVIGILVGAVPLAPGDVLGALFGGGDAVTGVIVRDLRAPRVIAAALVGGALAVAGALLQGLFRNPLADPYVTGTSAGGALGAVAVIAIGGDLEGAVVPSRPSPERSRARSGSGSSRVSAGARPSSPCC